jgi:hypothetical protein
MAAGGGLLLKPPNSRLTFPKVEGLGCQQATKSQRHLTLRWAHQQNGRCRDRGALRDVGVLPRNGSISGHQTSAWLRSNALKPGAVALIAVNVSNALIHPNLIVVRPQQLSCELRRRGAAFSTWRMPGWNWIQPASPSIQTSRRSTAGPPWPLRCISPVRGVLSPAFARLR